MKKSLSLVLALFSSSATLQIFAPPAPAAPAAPATETPAQRAGRVAIDAAYTEIDKALATGKAAVTSYYAPNYSVQTMDWKVHKRDQNKAGRRQPAGVPMRFKVTRNMSFTWRDKDVKNIVVNSQVTAVGKVGTGARTIPIKMVKQSRDLWTLTPRGWKIRQTIETGGKAWANGKQVR